MKYIQAKTEQGHPIFEFITVDDRGDSFTNLHDMMSKGWEPWARREVVHPIFGTSMANYLKRPLMILVND